MRELLVSKNVAKEIADDLCDSVSESLVGKRLPAFTRVSSEVRVALEAAILRILTPKRSIGAGYFLACCVLLLSVVAIVVSLCILDRPLHRYFARCDGCE